MLTISFVWLFCSSLLGVTNASDLHDAIFAGDKEKLSFLLSNCDAMHINEAIDEHRRSPLHAAVFIGDCVASGMLIDAGANVEALDNLNYTPLEYAVLQNNPDIVELLVERKADVNHSDVMGMTPLHLAARKGFLTVATILTHDGRTKINHADVLGWTPLHWAVNEGKEDVVRVLVNNGVHVNAADDMLQATALHKSIIAGHDSISDYLLASYASLYQKDIDGKTAVHYAAEYGRKTLLQTMISLGGDVNDRDIRGNSPLHCAIIQRGDRAVDVVQILLLSGAWVEATNNDEETPIDLALSRENYGVYSILSGEHDDLLYESKFTMAMFPVHYAISFIQANSTHIRSLLLTYNPNKPDHLGRYPMHLAVIKENEPAVKALLTVGGDVKKKDIIGNTSLHLARRAGMAQLLLESDLSAATICNDKGNLPLHQACDMDFEEVVRVLVMASDLRVRNNAEQTALDIAARNGNVSMMECLLMHGAEVNSGTIRPLHWAAYEGSTRAVELLLKWGASVDVLDKAGRNPIYYAALNGHADTVRMLLRGTECASVIQAVDFHGHSLLHCSVLQNSNEEISRMFVVGGVSVDQKTRRGKTSLHVCAMRGLVQTAKMLVANGCDVFIRDARGRTALHTAVRYSRHEIVTMLLDADPDLLEVRVENTGETVVDTFFRYEGESDSDVKILDSFLMAGAQLSKMQIGMALKMRCPVFAQVLEGMFVPISFQRYIEYAMFSYFQDFNYDSICSDFVRLSESAANIGVFYSLIKSYYPKMAVLELQRTYMEDELRRKEKEYMEQVAAYEASRDHEFYCKALRFMLVEILMERRNQLENTYIDTLPRELIDVIVVGGVNRGNILGQIKFLANSLMLALNDRRELEACRPFLEEEMKRMSEKVFKTNTFSQV